MKEKRDALITKYTEATEERIELARVFSRELKALTERFTVADTRIHKRLEKYSEEGEDLALYTFQIEGPFDVDIEDSIVSEYIESLEDDELQIPTLWEEAKEAEEDGDEEEEEDEEDEEDEE